MAYAVDIPNQHNPEAEWVCLGYFDTKAEAIAYVAETFGGDAEGKIGLVSELPDDEEEGES
jgi:hypothetical protein